MREKSRLPCRVSMANDSRSGPPDLWEWEVKHMASLFYYVESLDNLFREDQSVLKGVAEGVKGRLERHNHYTIHTRSKI